MNLLQRSKDYPFEVWKCTLLDVTELAYNNGFTTDDKLFVWLG